jgi:AraC-like DNA-binding protein/predicted enzyme related to lactoylglutathione lyase
MPTDTDQERQRRVREVLRYIRDHVDADLSLRALSRRAACSPHHFHRVFLRLTGTTLHRHVRSLRLRRAATALRSSRADVLRIALDAGFRSHESFTRAFRGEFGVPPSAYRSGGKRSARKAPARGDEFAVCLVKVPVTDFGRARAFYRDALGLHEEFAVEAYGWANYRAGAVPLALYVVGRGGGDGVPGGELAFHLAVRDATGLHRRLAARGVPMACDLVTSDDGGCFFMPRDPDGNIFKITQAR